MTSEDRWEMLNVRLIKAQYKLLGRCAELVKQTKTELVREALARFLPDILERYSKTEDSNADNELAKVAQ